MKIKKVTVFRENLELTRPYTIADEAFTHAENLFVYLETDTGLMGIGARSQAEDERSFSMADESLHNPADAYGLIHPPRPFGLFNIKGHQNLYRQLECQNVMGHCATVLLTLDCLFNRMSATLSEGSHFS